MKEYKRKSPMKIICATYIICVIFRLWEYMWLRTDQSMFGEAFLHKLMGILVLIWALRYVSLSLLDIGFSRVAIVKHIGYGLLLGMTVFLIAYGVEFFLQLSGGNSPSFQFYVSSYSIRGNLGQQTGLMYFAFCIIGNIINVVMEEGVFRGLFVRLAEKKHSFLMASLISSILFGIWHVAAPLRGFLDGDIHSTGALLASLMLFLTTAVTGLKFCLMVKVSGSLWFVMADHFFNNTIVNVLHITTISGIDEFQLLRISIAQTISFLLVLYLYWKRGAHQQVTFRP